MNGLLHRMAARAAGTAVAVRSDARLPYAGGGAGLGGLGEAASNFSTGAEPLAQTPSASAILPHEHTARPAGLQVSTNSTRAPSPLVSGLHDAGAVRDTPQIAPNAAFTQRVDSTQPSTIDEPQLTMPPQHAEPVMPRTVPLAIESELAPAHTPLELAMPAHRAMRADEPAPLMPREPRPAPLSPVLRPADRRAALSRDSAATQHEADTEVHIHIGRIDVTAVHEVAPPRRRAAAAPAPMSLDGYLAQRGRS